MGFTIAPRTFSRWTDHLYNKFQKLLPTALLCLPFRPSTVGHLGLHQRQNPSRLNPKFGSSNSAYLESTNSTYFTAMSQASLRFSSTIHSGSLILRNNHGPVSRPHNVWLYAPQNASGNSTWTTASCAPPLQATLDHRKAELGLSCLTMVLLPTS